MRRHKNEENAYLPEHDIKILNFVAEESEREDSLHAHRF